MIKLYGNPYSRANRVRWALEFAGAEYVEEIVELGAGGTKSAEFMKVNPNGRIPVLDDDGYIIYESVAICMYLARKYMSGGFGVEGVQNEGRLFQWSIWAMTELEANVELASLHVTWFSEDKRDAIVAENAQSEIKRCLRIIQKEISSAGYLVGDRFTISDLIVSEVLTGIVHTGVDIQLFPEVHDYLKKNLSSESAKRSFSKDIIAPYVE